MAASTSNGKMKYGNTRQTNRMAKKTIHTFCKKLSTVMGNQTSTEKNNILDSYHVNMTLEMARN
jgi:hypothetical protein